LPPAPAAPGVKAIRELYLSALRDEMPESDRSTYTSHWQQRFASGRAGGQTSSGLCTRQHMDKIRFYIGDDPTNLDFLVNIMNEAVNANYECCIQVTDLLSPPNHMILPTILDDSNISIAMLSDYMARGQLPGHVSQHLLVTSVIIFENGDVVPNPEDYPIGNLLHRTHQELITTLATMMMLKTTIMQLLVLIDVQSAITW
jgi:hypothetical protein